MTMSTKTTAAGSSGGDGPTGTSPDGEPMAAGGRPPARRQRLSRFRVLLLAVVAVVGVSAAVVGSDRGKGAEPVLGPEPVTVELRVEHSRFSPDHLTVRAGTTVRFVIVNGDPINHEFIVGPDEVHRRHESGSEKVHPPVPGEVSVAAGARAETSFTFGQTGDALFACHLPGHFAYGMSGTVTVILDN
jgi:uncharacterized cupredoxin-like copper-binding protein